jgi:HK97 family phage major capsid protein
MSLEIGKVLDAIETLKTAQKDQFKGLEDTITIQGKEVTTLSEKMKASDDAIVDLTTRLAEIEKIKTPRKVVLAGLELEKDEFSFVRAINAIRSGRWENAGFENEVFQETRKKAQSMGTGSEGGYLVPANYIAELIELIRASTVIDKLGATILNNLTGSPVKFPKQTGGGTGYWTGENTAITDSSTTLGELNLTPKRATALVKLSNSIIKHSNPSIEAMVRRDIALTLALLLDLGSLRGSGTSDQPTGIVNTADILTYAIGTNGGDFDYDHFENMIYEMELNNTLRGNVGLATHPKIISKLKKIRIAQFSGQTDGEYLMLPMSDKKLRELLDYNFAKTTQLPINLTKGSSSDCAEVILGNFQELLVCDWGGLELMASKETSDAFAKDQTWIRAIQEVDCGLRHPESFVVCSDARTN